MSTNELSLELRRFAESHPEGWGHDEWVSLLDRLSGDGHDVSDQGEVGRALERERLSQTLQRIGVKGLGQKRINAITNHFETVWALSNASPEDVAQVPNVPRSLASQIVDSLSSR